MKTLITIVALIITSNAIAEDIYSSRTLQEALRKNIDQDTYQRSPMGQMMQQNNRRLEREMLDRKYGIGAGLSVPTQDYSRDTTSGFSAETAAIIAEVLTRKNR